MAASLNIEDHDALAAYLRETGRGDPLRIATLAGGVSNRTVLVELAEGEQWVLKQALPKLRVQVDWFSAPERIHREALALQHLAGIVPAGSIPRFVFEDSRYHLLAMSAVPEPHENWKTALLAGNVEPHHFQAFGEWLGAVHRSGGDLAAVFEERAYFESLRLEPYYEYSAGQAPAAAGFLRDLCRTTRATRVALVHGDYSPKNVMLHAGRMVVLDYEVIHFGDPAFDIGFSLCHMLSKAHHLPRRRGALAGAARLYWSAYRASTGAAGEGRGVLHTLACLLARVAGRSPLEYLDESERARQLRAALALMQRPPATVPALIDAFLERIEQCP